MEFTPLPKLWETRQPGYVNEPALFDLGIYKKTFPVEDEVVTDDYGELRHIPRSNRYVESIGTLETSLPEILERQNILNTFLSNPVLLEPLRWEEPPRNLASTIQTLSSYSQGQDGFYSSVRSCIETIDGITNRSDRLDDVRGVLESWLTIEPQEREVVEEMTDDVKRGYEFVGVMKFIKNPGSSDFRWDKEATSFYGYRTGLVGDDPDNVIDQIPDSVIKDVYRHITRTIDYKDVDSIGDATLWVNLSYSKGELSLEADLDVGSLSADSDIGREKGRNVQQARSQMSQYLHSIGGLSFRSGGNMRKLRQWTSSKLGGKGLMSRMETISTASAARRNVAFLDKLEGVIASPLTHEQFGADNFETVAHRFKDRLTPYREMRVQFADFAQTFDEFRQVARFYSDKVEEGFAVAFPDLKTPEDRKTEVRGLYPFRLVTGSPLQKDEIVPHDFNDQNGVTVITGNNMGGKSVYLDNSSDLYFQAQLGLPLLLEHLPKGKNSPTISIRDAMFTSYETKGQVEFGTSTFGTGTKRIIDILNQVPQYRFPHIIVDELSAGTDPDATRIVSNMVLRGLDAVAQNGSAYVVTQFHDIATLARDEFGVHTLMLDGHAVNEGIGKSEGVKVAAELGLTDSFIDSIVTRARQRNAS